MKKEELYYGLINGFIAFKTATYYDFKPTQLGYWLIAILVVSILSYLSPTKKKTSSNE